MGTVICVIAHSVFSAEAGYCESCASGACYAADSAHVLTGFHAVSATTLSLCIIIAVFVFVLSMVPPISFWVKGQFVYGMLLSCLTFRLSFLCPESNSNHLSLAVPEAATAGGYVLAIIVAAVASSIGLALSKVKGWFSGFVIFVSLYASILVILSYWRLSH